MNAWQNPPKLEDKFSHEFPDDIQVIVHNGGPSLTDSLPELVWVRVTTRIGPVFEGTVLNQPEQLTNIKVGSVIKFLVPDGGQFPLMVTEKYLHERPNWEIHPCEQCGLTELFDAPSDIIRAIFPNIPEGSIMEMFTSLCGACGGKQGAHYRD